MTSEHKSLELGRINAATRFVSTKKRLLFITATIALTAIAALVLCSLLRVGADDSPPYIRARAIWLFKESNNATKVEVGSAMVDKDAIDASIGEKAWGDTRTTSIVPGHVAFIKRHVEYGPGDRTATTRDTLVVITRKGETDYVIPLPTADALSVAVDISRDGTKFVASELVQDDNGSVQDHLLMGSRLGISKHAPLLKGQIVEALDWSESGNLILCVVRLHGSDPIRLNAMVVDASTLDILHSVPLPGGARYAGWSRDASMFDCLYFEGNSVIVDTVRFLDNRRTTVLKQKMGTVMGGRFVNVGPDGLVRFYVNTPFLPNGNAAESFDGWRHHYVFDTSARKLFRLGVEIDNAVFLERVDTHGSKGSNLHGRR